MRKEKKNTRWNRDGSHDNRDKFDRLTRLLNPFKPIRFEFTVSFTTDEQQWKSYLAIFYPFRI